MNNLNEKKFNQMFTAMAGKLLQQDSTLDYTDETGIYSASMKQLISQSGLTPNHLPQIDKFVTRFEKKLNSKYKTNALNGIAAFSQDLQGHYAGKNVPQLQRIKSGLFDSLTGQLYMASGAIKFMN